MALFGKKNCDICNGKIGLLGNRKLEDGNLCKECAKKLSPFFSDRKKSTVEEIRGQLNYREANEGAVRNFNPSRTLGLGTKLILDDGARKFIVSPSRKWRDENPDVIDFSQVTGSYLQVDESQREIMQKDRDGKEISYNPRRMKHMYDFWMTIHVNHPYFNEIKFKINDFTIEIEPNRNAGFGRGGGIGQFFIQGGAELGRENAEYRRCEEIAEEIKQAFSQGGQSIPQNVQGASYTDQPVTEVPTAAGKCPHCGATTSPNSQGNCEFCGGSMKVKL